MRVKEDNLFAYGVALLFFGVVCYILGYALTWGILFYLVTYGR